MREGFSNSSGYFGAPQTSLFPLLAEISEHTLLRSAGTVSCVTGVPFDADGEVVAGGSVWI